MKFKIPKDEPWKIYEDTGDPKKDRLIMYTSKSGGMFAGPGLGHDTNDLYNAVPEILWRKIMAYWEED